MEHTLWGENCQIVSKQVGSTVSFGGKKDRNRGSECSGKVGILTHGVRF